MVPGLGLLLKIAFDPRIRDARKVRQEQGSGDETSSSGIANSLSSRVVGFTGVTRRSGDYDK